MDCPEGTPPEEDELPHAASAAASATAPIAASQRPLRLNANILVASNRQGLRRRYGEKRS
jgi:hypothetical protein